ncbi:MAG TPA: hypothetical protein EYP34_09740 [Chromatiaceae bacterium]|nr:hypothetical protein [Chromatiaceae bacterium]
MADEDKDKSTTKVTRKKVVKKKVAKKKVAKKKVAKKKAASKKKVAKKMVKKAASNQAESKNESANKAADDNSKPVSNAGASGAEKPTASAQASAVRETARPAEPKKRAESTNSAATIEKKPRADESAAWWLNVALVIVIAAITVLLYFMTQFGDLKEMDIDRIWSYFAPASVAESTQPPVPAEAPVSEVNELVAEKEVIMPETPAPEQEAAATLQPLPEEQQQLLWEALMAPPRNP